MTRDEVFIVLHIWLAPATRGRLEKKVEGQSGLIIARAAAAGTEPRREPLARQARLEAQIVRSGHGRLVALVQPVQRVELASVRPQAPGLGNDQG